MRSVLRIATPVTLKPPPTYPVNPFSLLGKRATFAVVIADGQATLSNHPPPVPICHVKEAEPLIGDIQQISLLTRPVPVRDVGNDMENNGTANSNTSLEPTIGHSSSAPIAHDPCSSFPVHGPFDIFNCIQSGGFGSAWVAKDQSTGRLLCLKMFHSLHNPEVMRSVQTEFRVFRRMVKSKGGERGKQFIMELNRSIQQTTTVFFAMELMTFDLGSYLHAEPERCKMHARRWTAQIALGIKSLHEMGILHRDVKTENILIDPRENVRIIDFGLSYMDPTGEPLRQGYGYGFDFLGTPSYMAPEVLRNKGMPAHRWKRYGTTVDWWALGCILFELESRDHQPLFNEEEDVHAYVAWTQKPILSEETHPRFECLDPVVTNLVEGLLRVQPSIRYSFDDLEKHDYFLLCKGSEFDNTAARALGRPIRLELIPKTTGDGPITIIQAAKLSSIFDWTNLKWAHQTG